MQQIAPSPSPAESGLAHDAVFVADLQLAIQWELQPTAAQLLMEHSERRSVRCGEIILREGAASPGLFFILAGEVEVVAQEEGKRDQSLYRLTPGDVFGETVLQNLPALTGIRAGHDCRILFVESKRLDDIMDSIPMAMFLLKRMQLRVKSGEKLIRAHRPRPQTLH